MEPEHYDHRGARRQEALSLREQDGARLLAPVATQTDLRGTEPTLCTEHMELRRRAEDRDGLLNALEATQSFLKSEAVEGEPHGVLREFALVWCDEVTEKAAEASHKAHVAEFLAARDPHDKEPESSVMREYGAHLLVRSDSINNAVTALVDGRELSQKERLATIAALKEAYGWTHDEYEKFRREQGLCD